MCNLTIVRSLFFMNIASVLKLSAKFSNLKVILPLLAYIELIRPMSSSAGQFYQLTPIKLGVEVRGVSLQIDPPDEVIQQIKHDVHKYRVMVFRDQGIISGKRHVEISKWFGPLESTFYKHPKSPDLDVFRVSNVESEGCTGVGRTGWHVDGSFQPAPFGYALYHIHSVPKKGDTVFIPLYELIMGLGEDKKARWERLWMVSDRRGGRLHPLIYSHPVTGYKTLCFHLGMTEGFVWDYQTDKERWTEWPETRKILLEIEDEIMADKDRLQYSHKWTQGDFIMSDNLSVGHEASPETQLPYSEVGLRVMHRTTVSGHRPPAKEYNTFPPRPEYHPVQAMQQLKQSFTTNGAHKDEL